MQTVTATTPRGAASISEDSARPRSWGALLLMCGLAAAPRARADALAAVQVLRAGGCGGVLPAARPLRRSAQLENAAAQWAAGESLQTAAGQSGYGSGAAPAGARGGTQ